MEYSHPWALPEYLIPYSNIRSTHKRLFFSFPFPCLRVSKSKYPSEVLGTLYTGYSVLRST